MATEANLPPPEGLRRVSVAHFLIAQLLLLAVVPFVDQMNNGPLIEASLFTLVLLMGVTAIGGRRKTFIIAAILVIPAAVGRWLDHFWPYMVPPTFTNVASIIYVAFVIFHLARFILRAPRVNGEVLCAGVSVYILLGIIWAFAYMLLSRINPASFAIRGEVMPRQLQGYESLFLSFGTLTNVVFDEVSLVTKPARMLAMTQAMTSIFYMTMFIARLVAIYSTGESVLPSKAPRG